MAGPAKTVSQDRTGYLKEHGLNLKQSEKVRKNLSKKATARFAMEKLTAVSLDWKRK
jgi:hypothetical protein